MRLHMYDGAISTVIIAVLYHAFKNGNQLLPEMVTLLDSKICLLILWVVGMVFVCLARHLCLCLFLGLLQKGEVERLTKCFWRKSFSIICNVILFRKFFTIKNLGIVFAISLIKNLECLDQKTTENVRMRLHVPLLSHLGFVVLLLVIDVLFLQSQAKHLIDTWQMSVSLYFSLEFMISVITTGLALLKYILLSIDIRGEAQWARKLVFAYYLDLIRDVLCLSMNLGFLLAVFVGLELRLSLVMIDKLWETFCDLKIRVDDFVRCWELTSNMKGRFPDATLQELNANDDTCGICQGGMETAKKLRCRHFFHFYCLQRWLMERKQASCPICRSSITPP